MKYGLWTGGPRGDYWTQVHTWDRCLPLSAAILFLRNTSNLEGALVNGWRPEVSPRFQRKPHVACEYLSRLCQLIIVQECLPPLRSRRRC